MKITTILKIYDVLKEEGYETIIKVHHYKSFAFISLEFHKGRYRETLFSKSQKSKYVYQKLNGKLFRNLEIKESK